MVVGMGERLRNSVNSDRIYYEIINKLNAEVVKVVAMPAVRERLAGEGADPVGSTPEQYDAYIRTEIEKWMKVAAKAGITPE